MDRLQPKRIDTKLFQIVEAEQRTAGAGSAFVMLANVRRWSSALPVAMIVGGFGS